MQDAKSRHLRTIVQRCLAIFSQLRHISTIGKKNLLSSNISSRCPHNMVNFGPLAAKIGLPVWGTPVNFNGFRILAALLHGTQVVSVSQTLRHWTEGVFRGCRGYVRQGDHHVGHWPTFWLFCVVVHFFWLVNACFCCVRFVFPTKPRDWFGKRLRNDL